MVVLWLQPRPVDGHSYAELQMYQYQTEQNCFTKNKVVRLHPFDNLAIAFSVVDDLLIAHHQTTQTCLVFDLNIPCEYDQFVSHYCSLVPPQPANWLQTHNAAVRVPVLPDLLLRVDGLEAWRLKFNLNTLIKRIGEQNSNEVDEAAISLLLALGRMDKNAKWQVVNALKRVLLDVKIRKVSDQPYAQSYFLRNFKSRFDLITKVMPAIAHGGTNDDLVDLLPLPDISPPFYFRLQAMPSQSQLANGAYDVALRSDRTKAELRLAAGALMEFVRALVDLDKPVEYSLAELLVHHFTNNKNTTSFFQLYQLLQYRVVTDSVPLACSLLALSRQWPGGYQISLDMLRRLPQGRGISHAAEILLTSGAPPIDTVKLINNTARQMTGNQLSGQASANMVPTTPQHAALMAAISNSPTKAGSQGQHTSPGGATSGGASGVVLPPMDPRKPLDFAVSSEDEMQLLAILLHHQSIQQQGTPSGGNQHPSWLAPYWDSFKNLSTHQDVNDDTN